MKEDIYKQTQYRERKKLKGYDIRLTNIIVDDVKRKINSRTDGP